MKMLYFAPLLFALPAVALAKGEAAWLTFAGRPAADIQLDASRKPIETLTYLGLKKNALVLDYMAGGGYYAEIMAKAAGKKGRVTAWNPSQFVSAEFAKTKWGAIAERSPNVTHVVQPFDKFDAKPNSYTFALFHLTYHDLYWESKQFNIPRTDPDAVLRTLYAAMKPGGIVGVIDHRGGKGDIRVQADKLHRIDPDVVKGDFQRAGFQFAGESPHLRVATDDIRKSVFDPTVRNKTDRFVLKFVKPKK